MSQITRVDIPVTLDAADELQDWHDRLATALATLKREAELLHGCWGDDKFGQRFAESYLPYAEQTLANAQTTVDGLLDVATNLRGIAQKFAELDTDGARVLELADS